ncbi:MAG: nitrate/nitrite transporter NrtS [Altererythrobacter sp.]|nr:nitrate/nitrite transporter NrtS [Altererythrobacter sp.]
MTKFWNTVFHRRTIVRAAKVSAIVGTLLVAINQGPLILTGVWPPLWQVLLTYLVPYSVSSYSSAALWIELQAAQNGI